jgi:predicted RNase H-like nuclease (RuvC/YqgF family)
MNVNDLADRLEQFYSGTHIDKAVEMLRQQQEKLTKYELRHAEQRKRIDELEAEIEALKNGLSSAYWHDTFVEVKKPNSDLIYRFKLDDVCKHGVDDGACKECYMEAQK